MRAGISPAETGGPGVGPLRLTEREFTLFQTLVEREAGLHLGPSKQALLVGRLSRRVRALGLPSFGAYYRLVTARGNEEERVRMLDCLCTNETHFFREPEHFEFLRQRVFPEWTQRAAQGLMERRVRVWSAGCSTGEEPYSLAMALLSHFPRGSGWGVEVLATDLSTWALERAKQGLWPLEKAASIPRPLLRAFMLEGVRSQEGWMKAGRELREVLRFARVNLSDECGWPTGPFELVFCRNVLIYFGAQARARALSALLRRLPPTGYLFLGHAESLTGSAEPARCVAPNIYCANSPPPAGQGTP
ncbi:CheR family methyltransferase [Archangium sp.]|uniref:CheR family methyltransferase n=1 Tax=Archangium sp. TaxID=1872627 RepID=UPI002D376E78|nr:CheR family methyltransferase [Archangium sp.]HYO59541.1 CheR family methyltransferase [Archangium sp.]